MPGDPLSTPPASSAVTEIDDGFHLNHRVMYYVIRPIARRLPVRVFVALSMLIAIPAGTLQAIRRPGFYRRILTCIGRRDSLLARVRLAIRCAYIKCRHLEQYIYAVTYGLQATWDGPPETEPCVYFITNTYGSEAVAKWMDTYPSIVIRRAFAGEGQLDLATASPGQKWRAHQAAIRINGTGHREVIVGDNPLAYRKLLDGKTSILIFQDLWDEKKHEGPLFLGSPATLNVGSLRLAKLAGGLPFRFMTIQPRGPHWCIHVTQRVPATYETIASMIEADIKRRPAEWLLWKEWFAWVDGQI